MNEKMIRELQTKISDYTRFIYILLAVSTFLYLGTVIGNGEKDPLQMDVMMGTTAVLLGGAFYFAYKIKKMNKEMEKEEN
ncbi:YrhC family protein [Bacillus songklensis]|uniref:YrhC family protein n=1 Tax=Bacillus songklensis TaxID=1069116 RepID=A0ABV8AZL2_9BACI